MADDGAFFELRRFREAGVMFYVERGQVKFKDTPDWMTRVDALAFVAGHHEAIRAILQSEQEFDPDRLTFVWVLLQTGRIGI